MNKVILSGRLVADPEVRYTTGESSMAIARFRMAVDRRKKDAVDFFECSAFGKTAEFVEKYIKKGMKVFVTGRIENDNYTNRDGVKVYSVKVIVEDIEFGESKKATESAGKEEEVAPAAPDGFVNVPDDVMDSNLPFN